MILIPSDRLDEEPVILDRIRRGQHVHHYETVRRRKDGSLIDISLTVSPVKNDQGKIIGASKIARDITELKRARELERLLLREMSHRIKNLLAVARGLVTMSARFARTPDDMAGMVRDSLDALARPQELVRPEPAETREINEQTTLEALVRENLSPYVSLERKERVILSGPDVPIAGHAVTSLALALHEFATNAAKYGALSSPRGRIQVDWSVEKGELRLTWRECDGSVDAPPDDEGFGSFLARRSITSQLGGQLTLDWKAEGLTIHLSVPLERLTH